MKKLFLITLLSQIFIVNTFASVTILKHKGKIEILRGEQKLKLNKKLKLLANDFVRTSDSGFLKLKIKGAVITLAPQSTFQIPTTDKSEDKSINHGKLWYGHLKLKLSSKEKSQTGKEHKVYYPTSSMAIRGTEVLAHVTRSKKEFLDRYKGKIIFQPDMNLLTKEFKPHTQICCLEGKVELQVMSKFKETLIANEVFKYTKNADDKVKYKLRSNVLQKTVDKLGLNY